MRIKGFFYILVFLLLALGSVLLFLSSQLNTIFFYIGEGLILFILIYLTFFYRKIVKPLNTIGSGMELLREQDFSSRLSPVGQYEADRVVNIFNRMMEQLKNERLRLREQNNFLDLLIKASPMGVIITSLDEDLSELNPMALKMLGVRLEDAQGKKMKEIDSPLAVELANLPKGEKVTVRLNDSNIYRCTHSSFIDRGFQHPFYLVETLTDEVMKAEKKAYEKVIRMIAHEVNNSVAGVTSTLDSLSEILEPSDENGELRAVIQVCSERCYGMNHFISRLAEVVKIPEPNLRTVSLNSQVEACRLLMEQVCRQRGIRLTAELDAGQPKARLDAVLFEQVLVNIVKNAAESTESGGEIRIRTTLHPLCLEVADNGAGIAPENEDKLFTPFFSTKPSGQGIGLMLIREILTRHGCLFSLKTEADGWTRFRICFPEVART